MLIWSPNRSSINPKKSSTFIGAYRVRGIRQVERMAHDLLFSVSPCDELQIASSSIQTSTQLQIPRAVAEERSAQEPPMPAWSTRFPMLRHRSLEWNLEFPWSLILGVWRFVLDASASHTDVNAAFRSRWPSEGTDSPLRGSGRLQRE